MYLIKQERHSNETKGLVPKLNKTVFFFVSLLPKQDRISNIKTDGLMLTVFPAKQQCFFCVFQSPKTRPLFK